MNRLQFLIFAALTMTVGTAPILTPHSLAQQARVSAPDVTGAVIDGSRVTVYYSRPKVQDPKTGAVRKIFGALVPFGQVWRLGANEATLLVTQQTLQFGTVTVPAGASTLFLLPQADGTAKLIVNKQVGQWGTQYDEKQDIVRLDVKAETMAATADLFTMSIARDAAVPGGGTLKMMWENTSYSLPFTIKK